MSIKSGFTTLSDQLVSVVVLGVVHDSNRHLIIQLDGKKNENRILRIHAAYRQPTGTTAFTNLIGGRLLVVGTKYDDDRSVISPRDLILPAGLSGAQVFLDIPIANETSGNVLAISRNLEFMDSIRIPAGTDASIILTFCENDAIAFPGGGEVNAFLTVSGLTSGSDKPFKNV